MTARGGPVTFDPRQLVLTVDDQGVHPSGAWVNNQERERKVIDDFVKARRQASPDQPPLIPRSSEWRDAVTAPVTVRRGKESPRFFVTFPVPLLSPERTLSLDLTPAISGPPLNGLPLIRFKPMRWSEGYS